MDKRGRETERDSKREKEREEQGMDLSKWLYGKTCQLRLRINAAYYFFFSISDFVLLFICLLPL